MQVNKEEAGAVTRVAAQDIEDRVGAALRECGILVEAVADPRETIRYTVDRITVSSSAISIALLAETNVKDSP